MAFKPRISFAEARILIPKNSERRFKMINYIDNARQEQIVNGARTVNSRDEMRNYVESIAKM